MQIKIKVEKATIGDVPSIQQLINHFADQSQLLHRPLSELYENLRDYFVVRDGDQVVGCGSLHIVWDDLAEIKALAVAEGHQSQGIGGQIVAVCIGEAKELGIPTVFCLTYRPTFFERFGFSRVDLMSLPRKVWGECFRCPKFPNCDETALIVHLSEARLPDGRQS